MLNIFKSALYKQKITDQNIIDTQYKYWRMRIFYSMFVGYVFFYFTRKNFTVILTTMEQNEGYTYAQLGLLGTVFYITYGLSKFCSGILSDRSNPRYFMSTGLILTGIFNICFGFSSSLWALAFFWGLNGIFQGWGWPAITKLLTHWYGEKERGTWWSICGTSHNVGGGLIPIIAAYFVVNLGFGWRAAMYIPGVMCILVGLFLINRLRDIPQSLGLPPIEEYQANKKSGNYIDVAARNNNRNKILSAKQILFQHILNNKYVWILSISYFFVYVVRTAINDWTIPYLMNVKNYENLQLAAYGVTWFEVGGFVGMLAAGWGSDHIFKGNRIPYMLFCAIGLVISIYLFCYFPFTSRYLDYFLIAGMGFLVFGPQMLAGLAAAEYVNKKASCTANGFASCFGYVGAAFAGAPIGKIIDYSWDLYFSILIICSLAIFIILLPLVFGSTENYKKHSIQFN